MGYGMVSKVSPNPDCTHIIDVKFERIRRTLRPRPERLTGRRQLILGQVVEQLLDLVDIVFLKLEPRPLDALFKAPRSFLHEVLAHRLELFQLLARRLELLDKVGRREVQVDIGRWVDKELVKLFSRPLDRVFDRVGEVFDGTRRNRLLGRVLRRRVGLGDERNDDLRVGLCSERAGFEERLLVKDASSVHVLT
jgi:hypothetical protein